MNTKMTTLALSLLLVGGSAAAQGNPYEEYSVQFADGAVTAAPDINVLKTCNVQVAFPDPFGGSQMVAFDVAWVFNPRSFVMEPYHAEEAAEDCLERAMPEVPDYIYNGGQYDGPDGYGEPEGEYGPQDGEYGPQDGQYGPQDGEYGPHDGQYGPQDGEYGPHDGQYGPQDGEYGPQDGQYGPQDGEYGPHDGEYGPQDGEHGPQDGQYGPDDQDDDELEDDDFDDDDEHDDDDDDDASESEEV